MAGEARLFDRDSGVGLVDAVAASYVDGGVRSAENADLAEGCGRVVPRCS